MRSAQSALRIRCSGSTNDPTSRASPQSPGVPPSPAPSPATPALSPPPGPSPSASASPSPSTTIPSANLSPRPPLGPPPEYRDSFSDLLFMHLCRQAFGRVAEWQSPRPWAEGYLGMVEVSRALMRGRSAEAQRSAVLQGFPRVPGWFRRLFPFSHWGAEANAAITPRFFSWLVGPCHVEEAEIPAVDGREVAGGKAERAEAGGKEGEAEAEEAERGGDWGAGGTVKLQCGVRIERCRYLETSGCVGMCVNLCKMPTQHFFTHELGVPLTMEPNFEDFSCRMVFGLPPPPPSADPALHQPCIATSCPVARLDTDVPCHQLQ
ncbi:hypothetical protein CLOM_g7568 [Closterium sp. NIES-68]|nr:hypothetical protein CLOM_g7568 [Closterium sp. NIES-68]GJP59341.1 hypothetical protein CLOP_g10666 [Closterium sp. NIES-67]